jgi:hypothetical protein
MKNVKFWQNIRFQCFPMFFDLFQCFITYVRCFQMFFNVFTSIFLKQPLQNPPSLPKPINNMTLFNIESHKNIKYWQKNLEGKYFKLLMKKIYLTNYHYPNISFDTWLIQFLVVIWSNSQENWLLSFQHVRKLLHFFV